MPDSSESTDPRPSLQSEAQRLAEAARERAADAFEEIKVSSNQLVDKVRELIEEGNVRRISLRKGDKTLFEIPLTVGAGAAAAALLYNPLIAGIGAVAALVSDITLQIERDPDAETASSQKDASGGSSSDESSSGGTSTGASGGASGSASADTGKTMGRSTGGDTGGEGSTGDDAA